jgi:hypothetical protein
MQCDRSQESGASRAGSSSRRLDLRVRRHKRTMHVQIAIADKTRVKLLISKQDNETPTSAALCSLCKERGRGVHCPANGRSWSAMGAPAQPAQRGGGRPRAGRGHQHDHGASMRMEKAAARAAEGRCAGACDTRHALLAARRQQQQRWSVIAATAAPQAYCSTPLPRNAWRARASAPARAAKRTAGAWHDARRKRWCAAGSCVCQRATARRGVLHRCGAEPRQQQSANVQFCCCHSRPLPPPLPLLWRLRSCCRGRRCTRRARSRCVRVPLHVRAKR